MDVRENARVDEDLLDSAQQQAGRRTRGAARAGADPADAPAPSRPSAGRSVLRALRGAALPLAVAVASALLSCLLMNWMKTPGETLAGRFHVWDASFYVQIAESGYPHGYTYGANGQLSGNSLAFFPLYPLLIRIVHLLTGLAFGTSAVVVAWLCAAGAAVAVHHLVARLHSARVAGFAVALVFCQPMAVSLWIGYTESLFLLLAAAALLAVRKEAWVWAGVLTCLAGLTRSTGVAVAAALVVGVLLAARRERSLRPRMLVGCLLGCVGMPAYLLWVGLRVGQLDGWARIQSAGWSTAWDWGSSTFDFLSSTLHGADGWVQVSVAFVLLGYVVACAAALLSRPWPPLAVYGALILLMSLGQSNYYHSKPRLLVPVLLAVLPLAEALARGRRPGAYLALAWIAFLGSWFGAYMLTVWPYAI